MLFRCVNSDSHIHVLETSLKQHAGTRYFGAHVADVASKLLSRVTCVMRIGHRERSNVLYKGVTVVQRIKSPNFLRCESRKLVCAPTGGRRYQCGCDLDYSSRIIESSHSTFIPLLCRYLLPFGRVMQ